MDAFPIVRREDEQRYAGCLTEDVILALYDATRLAMQTGERYVGLTEHHAAETAARREG